MKKKRVKSPDKPSWLMKGTQEAIKHRDNLKKLLDHGKIPRATFNKAGTKVVHMVNNAKSVAIENELEENKKSSRLLWKAFTNLDQLLIQTIFVRFFQLFLSCFKDTHLMLYLRSFNLIVSTQSGFRPHHSTESILIKMNDDWLDAMDQGLFTGAIFLDLRKAFDVGNHELLVAKLQMYGCSSSALLWFKSYLSDGWRCVNIARTLSDTQLLKSGVPQGSILGPVLFLLSINDLPLTWKNRNGLFADDATFYANASNLTDFQVQLQWDLSNTETGTKDHCMAAHPQKTKYIIIGTRQKLSRCEEPALSLCLDGRHLEQTQEEHFLGLDIDPSLSWSSQVGNLRKKLLKRVAVLARIKKFLPVKYRIILFNASIKPILEYCVSV